MSETERIQDYGFEVGRDAKALLNFGATPEQIKYYVGFEAMNIRPHQIKTYMTAARRGYKAKEIDTFHGHMRLATLKRYVENGAACLGTR